MFAPRNIRHSNIVQFYGATFRQVPLGVEAVFVTEQCGGSLKTYLVEHSGNNPADNSMTVANVPRWAQQIVDALSVIHGTFQGCVHGDLRLENVLVSRGNFCFFFFGSTPEFSPYKRDQGKVNREGTPKSSQKKCILTGMQTRLGIFSHPVLEGFHLTAYYWTDCFFPGQSDKKTLLELVG